MARLRLLAMVLAAQLPGAVPARAGASMGCDGTETTVCQGGQLTTRCCPKGARCNFRNPPHIDCGDGTCVEGGDVGRCVPPEPVTTPARSAEACGKDHGSWERACVAHQVTHACIMPVPTNYTGPPHNPVFRTCREDRCTTSRFLEDCQPARGEVADDACAGAWTKVCLGGKVSERCLPWTLQPKVTYPARTYVTCPDGSCAVGSDKAACPR